MHEDLFCKTTAAQQGKQKERGEDEVCKITGLLGDNTEKVKSRIASFARDQKYVSWLERDLTQRQPPR